MTVDLHSPAPAATAGSAPDFELSTDDFRRICALIYQHAGIKLHEGKRAMVYGRLARRLRDTGHRSFGSYLQWLQSQALGAADGEWQQFVNCLTTNLTAFFREDHHFQALADDLRARAGRPLRIWCNAASTGEEPYSLAITALEALGPQADVRILATDIDTKVLAAAQRGVYAADARGLSAERLKRFFLRGTGRNTGFVRVKPELTRRIEFRPLNLMDRHWRLGEPFDMVFCRNVMIYFDADTQRQVLQQLHTCLRPDGLLYVGHSENFSDARSLFALRGKTIYARV